MSRWGWEGYTYQFFFALFGTLSTARTCVLVWGAFGRAFEMNGIRQGGVKNDDHITRRKECANVH